MPNVKEELCLTIRDLLQTTPINKITIKQLTDKVGINRQTFYYHYEDIYQLVWKMFNQEIKNLYSVSFQNVSLSQLIQSMINYAIANKNLFLNSIAGLELTVIQSYLQIEIRNIIDYSIDNRQKALAVELSNSAKKEISDLYTYYISGAVLHWLNLGFKNLDTSKAESIAFICENTFDKIIADFAEKEKNEKND